MSSQSPSGPERVAAALLAGGAAGEIRELDDSARTAAEAASALGVPVGAIVKSLVFMADDSPLLVLASGDHQVDTGAVADLVGAARVRRADPDTVRTATGFAIGGVAPVGHPRPLTTLVDSHLGSFASIWAAAGSPHCVFPTTYQELLGLTDGTPAEVAART
jgi:prolyl-tRNA editing enzyme YbaK/EbsC (Cys-tRNA(Pro) deacylase)